MKQANVQTAKLIEEPGRHFESPLDVVAATGISDAVKKKVLDRWEEDARRLSVATEEGMSGGEPSRMAEIAEAKAELGMQEKRRPAPTKAG